MNEELKVGWVYSIPHVRGYLWLRLPNGKWFNLTTMCMDVTGISGAVPLFQIGLEATPRLLEHFQEKGMVNYHSATITEEQQRVKNARAKIRS